MSVIEIWICDVKSYIWHFRNASKKWTMAIMDWKAAMNHFAVIFEKPVELYL